MKIVNLSEQDSIISQYISEIRDKDIQKDSLRFRRNIERIGECMAMDISKCLRYTDCDTETPLGIAKTRQIQDSIVLGTILRAGLPFHQGFLNMMDRAENAFLSAYRKEGISADGQPTLEIVSEYIAAPDLNGKTLILADPMLATGLSMEIAYHALLSHGTPKHLHVACVIGSKKGVAHLEQTLPKDATLWCAAIDPILNERNYIVPGLGDAGDLCFGQKL